MNFPPVLKTRLIDQSRDDLGRVGFVMPACHVFKDRADGTLYLLSHNSTVPEVVLTTPVPRRCTARPEEPIIETSQGRRRFYVEGGEFKWEEVNGGFTWAGLWTVNYEEKKITYKIDLGFGDDGEPLLVVEAGEEMLVNEDGEALAVVDGATASSLERHDIGVQV